MYIMYNKILFKVFSTLSKADWISPKPQKLKCDHEMPLVTGYKIAAEVIKPHPNLFSKFMKLNL